MVVNSLVQILKYFVMLNLHVHLLAINREHAEEENANVIKDFQVMIAQILIDWINKDYYSKYKN